MVSFLRVLHHVALVITAAWMLTACTTSPLHEINKVALDHSSQPFPADYKELVRARLGINRTHGLTISEPKAMLADTVVEQLRWSTCLKSTDGSEVVFVINRGKIQGTIAGPAPDFCAGGQYSPLD